MLQTSFAGRTYGQLTYSLSLSLSLLAYNILDVPNFFWDSEPTLHPLYIAIREYLEIDARIDLLNDRCKVFLDLTETLSDSVADTKMSKITWIIIVLICISIAITMTEVVLRFGILTKYCPGDDFSGNRSTAQVIPAATPLLHLHADSLDPNLETGSESATLELRHLLAECNMTTEELLRWAALWTEEQRHAVCAGTTFQ